jgi:formylglycine-generating enzyme required for sulfatase activity
MAYCRWLSSVTGKAITLPSEAQWEKAARGDRDRREYPWGDRWDAAKCNTSELGLGGTTPVGIFPEGASPYGCLDMVGNVWEWTQSLFKSYKYDSLDGREDLKAEGTRVLRGGSFYLDLDGARCACRNRNFPYFFHDFFGFRVVSLSASVL